MDIGGKFCISQQPSNNHYTFTQITSKKLVYIEFFLNLSYTLYEDSDVDFYAIYLYQYKIIIVLWKILKVSFQVGPFYFIISHDTNMLYSPLDTHFVV